MAEAFDLVLREYPGFTDDSILDLTLDRFRQMIAVIIQRKKHEMKAKQHWDLAMTELSARAIGNVLIGLAESKKQARSMKRLVDSFDFRSLLDGEKKEKEPPSTMSVMARMGVSSGSGLVGVR